MSSKKKSSTKPAAAVPVASRDSKFKVLRNVTMPTLKMQLETPIYVKFTAPHFIGRTQKPKAGEEAQKPATVISCVNLETGEVCQLVLGAALVSVLDEMYPNDTYVGRSFRIVKHPKVEGKRYFTYSVDEVEA